MAMKPKIRQASVIKPRYPLNKFPAKFAEKTARLIYAVKATSLFAEGQVDIRGDLWEEIFANSIGAKRETAIANGIDDIQDRETSTAWSAKTVKSNTAPDRIADRVAEKREKMDLIIGRNSTDYSYGRTANPKTDNPAEIAELVLEIWNERINGVRKTFSDLRTVVMVKYPKLDAVVIFEKEIELYDYSQYDWEWNEKNNLKGSKNGEIVFTWQPHGSQFKINNVVIPGDATLINIARPDRMNLATILESAGWDKSKFSAGIVAAKK